MNHTSFCADPGAYPGTSQSAQLATPTSGKLLARPYRPLSPLPPRIIDMHCHVAGIGAGDSGCFVSPALTQNWRFGLYLRSFGVTETELHEQGDMLLVDRLSRTLAQSSYVSHAVILAMDGVTAPNGSLDLNQTELYVPNDFVAAAAARHPNLLFGASVNPWRHDALERLAWAKATGAVLIKWLPSIMQIDPADRRLTKYYETLVHLDLPLLTHTGRERSFSSAADQLCDPDRLRLPLEVGVKVIAAHIASTGSYQGERSTDRLARMMTQYPNLYSDISALTQINKPGALKEALTRPEFADRLLYGTDFPLINTALVSPWYFALRLGPSRLFHVSQTENPWDADVLLKHYLGTPADIFSRSRALLLPQTHPLPALQHPKIHPSTSESACMSQKSG